MAGSRTAGLFLFLLFCVCTPALRADEQPDTNALTSVTLAWDPSPADNISGYNIYHGEVSAQYSKMVFVGNVSEAEVGGLVAGRTYYFSATAVVWDGTESEFSNEVEYTVPAPSEMWVSLLPPADQYSPIGSVVVEWTPLPDFPAATYAIYYGISSGTYSGRITAESEQTHVVIEGLTNGLTYFFAAAPIILETGEGDIFNETSYALPKPPPEPEVNFSVEAVDLQPTNEFAACKLTLTKRPPASLGYVVRMGLQGYEPDVAFTYGDSLDVVQLDGLRQGATYEVSVAWIAEDGSEQPLRRVATLAAPRVWPRLQLVSSPGGGMLLKGIAPKGRVLDVFVSPDLSAWDAITTCVAAEDGQFEYEDPGDSGAASRFYMVLPR